jgi:apolipoprotein D and lipocalin family protein
MKLLRFLVAVALIELLMVHAMAQTDKSPLRAVSQLDVQRYLGRWYEIAKFPNRFQKQCVSDTTADYALMPGGDIRVLNQCRNGDGNWEMAMGLAKQIDGPQSAKLKVRFAPEWLSFLPYVWGNYWVIDLDEKYELVAVSEPQREFLWVLSRTPVVSASKYAELLNRLIAVGLNVNHLERTQHPLARVNQW